MNLARWRVLAAFALVFGVGAPALGATNVVVTVVDTTGAHQAGVSVKAQKTNGTQVGFQTTNSSGQTTFSLASASYLFVTGNGYLFKSATCTTPACTSATITITHPVTVSVVNTSGVAQANMGVLAQDASGNSVNFLYTDGTGQVAMSVPVGTIKFSTVVAGLEFDSASCTVPGCTSATITVTAPVTVSVVDTNGVAQANIGVEGQDASGNQLNFGYTDSTGHIALCLPVGTGRFETMIGSALFDSASCTVPGCTTATITVTVPILLTVLDASGNPIANQAISGQTPDGNTGWWSATNSQGQISIVVEPGAWQFKTVINGVIYTSGAAGSCSVPGCTTATIAVTQGLGGTCTSSSQCASGFCASGVCCNTACNGGTCGSCNLTGHVGTCTALTAGTVCRASAGSCDVAETCNGTSFACPADAFQPSTTVCRTAAGECDVAETCTGSAASCPSDAKKASGTACTDDGNVCTADQCDGSSTACQHPAGNAGTLCRASAGTCDVAETCTGTSTSCPANGFLASGTVCRVSAGGCDVAEACTGSSAACPADGFQGAGTVCRAQAGACDVAETCSGTTAACPADALVAAGTVCRAQAGVCDVAETCSGSSGACPADALVAAGTVCRASAGQCDVAEACTGGSVNCPADGKRGDGTTCSNGNSCTADTCQVGTCVTGQNTCVALTVEQRPFNIFTNPVVTMTTSTDKGAVMPGDTLTFTANVTNTGLYYQDTDNVLITNTGSSDFTIGSYQQTLEYFSPVTHAWVTAAKVAFDANGTEVDDPNVLTLQVSHLFGNVIPAGGEQGLPYVVNVTLPPTLAKLMSDPAQASSVRVVLHIDTGANTPGASSVADVSTAFADDAATAASTQGTVAFLEQGGETDINLTTTNPNIASGDTAVYTGSLVILQIPPRGADESAHDYRNRLLQPTDEYFIDAIGPRGVSIQYRIFIPVQVPLLDVTKSGPTQAVAGFTATYPVQLQNIGSSAASAIAIVDSVGGTDVGAQVTVPTSVAPGATGSATVRAASPVTQTPGPYTDEVAVTWKDPNGNSYGPLTSDFTTTLTTGHPEGYLTIAASGAGGPEILGTPTVLTATAIDGSGNPVANLPVHLAIVGANAQTASLVTGADGTATFSYNGPREGQDIATVSATINGPLLQAGTPVLTWASSVGAPCVGRATPLDVMMVVDGSPSMFNDNTVLTAQAAADAFIGDLNPNTDQIAAVVFNFEPDLAVQLTSNTTAAQSSFNTALQTFTDACSGFCPPDSSDFAGAFTVAYQELTGPRRRSGATPLMMFISDGGNTGPDPMPLVNQLKAAGVRVISVGLSENVNIPLMKQIASSQNDYFYAPTASELGWALQNAVGDVCRTVPPLVSAGGNQGAYEVRLPAMLTLQGEVHGAGPQGNFDVTSTWSEVSGPAPVTFVDPTSPTTQVLFTQPGTYVLQLETTDGSLTTASTTTVVVDPDPSIVGANLTIALAAPGPLTTGGAETATATLTDNNGVPIRNFIVQFTVGGANATTATVATNTAGMATFTYFGQKAGTDAVKATALGSTLALDSSTVSLQWVDPTGTGPLLTQGWIGSPANQSTVMGRVPVTLASTVNLASGTLTYWPSSNPSDTHVLTTTASGNGGATLATIDTTTLKNGAYILDLQGTDDHGTTQDNRVLVTVAGDYKPGRVVVETTDFRLPLAGMPITIGRRYDSLERNKVGDFGNGWSLAIGHPDLQVDPADNVTITMPNGRRVTFFFELVPPSAGPIVFGFLGLPKYVPEPGAFGTLTSDGCSVLAFDPGNPTPTCFGAIDTGELTYAPTTYTYADPSGIKYVMGADGTLKSITDRSGNTLTFAANGIVSSRGDLTVQFQRDAQGRITQVTSPPFASARNGVIIHTVYTYTYDDAGNLVTYVAPDRDNGNVTEQYQYNTDHLLTKTIDFNLHAARTSTYDASGRLLTDTDALGNVTSYAYDIPNHKTTTTYPDMGVVTDTFDDRGLLLSHKDQLNRITTHVYDANRNEIRRTNALNETTTYMYDANGNQTSSTNALGETTTTTYNAFSEPVSTTNPIGNTTTIVYDENGLPTSMADSMGVLATFTSSERGLPLSVTDAAGNSVYMGYDAAGNLTTRTDRLGRTTTSQYDGLGRLQATFDGRGNRTYNLYTDFGEITAVQNPLGLNRFYHRDNNGNVDIESGDNSLKQFTYVYDALNHVTKKTNRDGSFVTYTRDFRGNILTETDEAGHTTSYTYDLAGQLTKTTYADGTFTSQTYDDVGRPSSKTDERANTTTYGYQAGCDCPKRLTTVIDALNRTTTTTYDGGGRRTSVTDAANHTTSYVYDLRGHLIETDYADGASTHDTYDALGRHITSTDQTGATTTYGYDAEGQLTSVTDPLSHVTQYAYDANGNLTTVTDANNHTTTYAYDAKNRKTTRTLPLGMSETFTYTDDDDVATHTDFRGKITTMTYDSVD